MLLPAVPSAALGRWLLATASLAGRPSLAAHYAHADIENAMSAAIGSERACAWIPPPCFGFDQGPLLLWILKDGFWISGLRWILELFKPNLSGFQPKLSGFRMEALFA